MGMPKGRRSKTAQTTPKRESRRISYQLDLPLQAQYNADTGILLIETPVFEEGPLHGKLTLALTFTACAAASVARLMGALEEAGYPLADSNMGVTLQ